MRWLVFPSALAAVFLGFVFGASPAAANQGDSPKGVTLTLFGCSPGQATYQVIAGQGIGVGGLSVVGTNNQYVILTQSWTDESGFHSVTFGKAVANRQLVTCHYIGPTSGRDYTNVGFFTPVG